MTDKSRSLEGSQGPQCLDRVCFLEQVFPRSPCLWLPLQASWVFQEEEKLIVLHSVRSGSLGELSLFSLSGLSSRRTQHRGLNAWPREGGEDQLWPQSCWRNGNAVCKVLWAMVHRIHAVTAPPRGDSRPITANAAKSWGLLLYHARPPIFHIIGHLAYIRGTFLCGCKSCSQTITIF